MTDYNQLDYPNLADEHAENLRMMVAGPHKLGAQLTVKYDADPYAILAAAGYIESLTRERDELRRIFDEAPHMPGCYQSCPPRMCDCWKARVAAANP